MNHPPLFPLRPAELSSDLQTCRQHASLALAACTGRTLPPWPETPLRAGRSSTHPEFDLDIPFGALFYPCCGRDKEDAIRMFGPHVSACHFADAFRDIRPSHPDGTRTPAPEAHELPGIGNVVLGPTSLRERVEDGIRIVEHGRDGLLTLLEEVGPLAVFYYRGDSQGEGGSGTWWLGPVLRDVVLSRMLDRGLICTDGSNGDKDLVTPAVGSTLALSRSTLACVAEFPWHRTGRPMRIWQVRHH